MSTKRIGNLGISLQPGYELTYHDTGLIEGQCAFMQGGKSLAEFAEYVGTAHPDDDRVQLYAMRMRVNEAGVRLAVFDCVGLMRDPTDPVVQYLAANNTEAIETHPKFLTVLGGTAAAPLNGAKFDEDGIFLGFSGTSTDAEKELYGVRSYYASTMVVRSTWFTYQVPQFEEMGKIVGKPQKVPDIPGIKNWLSLSPSAEQVGRLFRCTREILGGDSRGVSKLIYGT